MLPSNARAILRMVLRSERGKYPKEELELFRKLESHMAEIQAQNWEQWQRISLTAKAVKKYSGCALDEEMLCHYGAKVSLAAPFAFLCQCSDGRADLITLQSWN